MSRALAWAVFSSSLSLLVFKAGTNFSDVSVSDHSHQLLTLEGCQRSFDADLCRIVLVSGFRQDTNKILPIQSLPGRFVEASEFYLLGILDLREIWDQNRSNDHG